MEAILDAERTHAATKPLLRTRKVGAVIAAGARRRAIGQFIVPMEHVPQSVKDDALRLFKEEIAAKKAINDFRRSGKN